MVQKMKKDANLNKESDFFSAKETDDLVILSLNKNLLIRSTDLTARDRVLDLFDNISRSDTIKVVVIVSSPEKSGSEEYVDFYRKVLESKLDRLAVHRMLNVFNQIILKIAGLNKVVVHSNSGSAIPLFLNISLACDYRIVADNTVFQKPYLKLGMVPTGGGAFFLSRILSRSKAFAILLSDRDISAHEALKLGIVDKIVPVEELEDAALEMAQHLARKPAGTLTVVKRLLNYSIKDLQGYLDFENQEILKIIGPHEESSDDMSSEFWKRLKENDSRSRLET